MLPTTLAMTPIYALRFPSCDKTDRTTQTGTFKLLYRTTHVLILRSSWSHLSREDPAAHLLLAFRSTDKLQPLALLRRLPHLAWWCRRCLGGQTKKLPPAQWSAALCRAP